MSDIQTAPEYRRTKASAILNALPGIALLVLYLWIGLGIIDFIALGLTQSVTVATVAGLILAAPGCVISWRIIRTCVEAERQLG